MILITIIFKEKFINNNFISFKKWLSIINISFSNFFSNYISLWVKRIKISLIQKINMIWFTTWFKKDGIFHKKSQSYLAKKREIIFYNKSYNINVNMKKFNFFLFFQFYEYFYLNYFIFLIFLYKILIFLKENLP